MRTAKGFTLLEITVALLILTFILFSLGVLIPLSQVRIRSTSHKDRALMIAEDMIGKIRALNWDDIPAPYVNGGSGGTLVFPPPPYPSTECSFDTVQQTGKITAHTIVYTIDVSTANIPDPEDIPKNFYDLKHVTIKVRWTESTGAGGSAQKEITLSSTIYGRYASAP